MSFACTVDYLEDLVNCGLICRLTCLIDELSELDDAYNSIAVVVVSVKKLSWGNPHILGSFLNFLQDQVSIDRG